MKNPTQSIELNWQLAATKQYCAIGITFNMNLLRDFCLYLLLTFIDENYAIWHLCHRNASQR